MMVDKKPVGESTEADLEAEIHGALRLAFPWITDGSIRHQTTFSFSLGRSRITIDGVEGALARGRADILLERNGEPLAVLELKRPGLVLDAEDEAQGLSYAQVLRAPLVVVTNGSAVKLLEAHTGREWIPEERSEEEFAKMVKSASLAATRDLKLAISTLMGSNRAVWAQAVRQISEQNIADLSGEWNQSLQPFVPSFSIPRQATETVLQRLRQGERLVMVEGPPLIGKSSVLREFTERTKDSEEFVTFFIEADAGQGILQQLGDILSQALNWPVNKDEVRSWLLRLSNTDGPALVFAVDGVGLNGDDFRRDIVDLSSLAFRSPIRLVIGVDETVADRLAFTSTGRKASAIGRRAARVLVSPLDDAEFAVAERAIWTQRIGIMMGGHFSPEFRLPWVIRAVVSAIISQGSYARDDLAAIMPPLLGLDLMSFTRDRFRADDELRRLFGVTAKAVIEDAQDHQRPISLVLESVGIYVVRRTTLIGYLEYAEIEKLVERGYLRPLRHDSGEDVVVVRTPELLASEAANVLALELPAHARMNVEATATWLSKIAGNLPLGDIVASQALVDAVVHGDIPFGLITALINSPPQQQTVHAGTEVAMLIPGCGTVKATFKEGGAIEVEAAGQRRILNPDPGDEVPVTHGNFYSWLILSHLAGRPFAMEDNTRTLRRVDPIILSEVGTCPIVLRRPGPDPAKSVVITHEIPDHGSIVCHESGIVEPITLSMLRFLLSEGDQARRWLQDAVERNSLPLLGRIDIALRQISGSVDEHKARFANEALRDLIRPAMSSLWKLH